MSLLRLEIRYPDGRKEVLAVDGARALIGSGAHCDVRLPIDQAQNEHVVIESVGGIVRAEARAFEPPATINGMAFNTMPIGPEMPLSVGNVIVFVSAAGADLAAKKVIAKKNETSPVVKLLGLLMLPVAAWLLLEPGPQGLDAAPTHAPDLFAGVVKARCPHTAPDQAAAFAGDKLAVAEGKRERNPFSPKDGVAAAELYDLAGACLTVAGNEAAALEATAAASALRASITQDFRARGLRLEHALKVGDLELAKSDLRVLRSLTEGRSGDYVQWLATVQQQARQRGGQ